MSMCGITVGVEGFIAKARADMIAELRRIDEQIVAFLRENYTMHYKNGREAKNGDKVVVFPSYGTPYLGIMYDSVAGNDFCNGKVVPISASDPMVNLQEALHFDDVKALLPKTPNNSLDLASVPDTSKPPVTNEAQSTDAGGDNVA